MDEKSAFGLAALAYAVADQRTAQTFDQVAFWGSSLDKSSSLYMLSEKWLKNRAYDSVFSQLQTSGHKVEEADVARAETIARIAEHVKKNPHASDKQKAVIIQQELESFIRTISNQLSRKK
eukprot:gene1706-4829_t